MTVQDEKWLIALELDASNEQYDACVQSENDLQSNVIRYEVVSDVDDIDARINEINTQVSDLDFEIENLTNHADVFDYAVAVASGALSGLIDSLWVGEFHLDSADELIEKFASLRGWSADSKETAQEFLENKFHTPNDSAYQKKKDILGRGINVGGTTHRFDDLAHHPTLIGLIASIVVRVLRLAVFINSDGKKRYVLVKTTGKDLAKIVIPAAITGLFVWLSNVANEYYEEEYGEELQKPIKQIIGVVKATPAIATILSCADDWFGHIMSDIATPTGIPGIFLSFLKYISSLPILRWTPLPNCVENIYKNKKMEFAGELPWIKAVSKQAFPIMLNEVFVRGFYFIRHLAVELKGNQDLKQVNWPKTIPFGNRTVERMMTIATGAFTAIDLADATVRGVIKSGGNLAEFVKNLVLRVNFVGLGRFAIAIGVDVGMGIKKSQKEKERIGLNNEKLHLLNAKLFYKEEKIWEAAKDAQTSINELFDAIEKVTPDIVKAWGNIEESITGIAELELGQDTRDVLADLLDMDEE